MTAALAAATDLFGALSDASRLRILAVLSRHELSVAELVEALGLVQSRVSAHLGRLEGAGLVRRVKEGGATRFAVDATSPTARRLIEAVAPDLGGLERDVDRAAAVVARRAAPKGSWPEAVAGEMEKHYSPGRTWESMARGLASLMTLGDVLDVGSGDGTIAALLAPGARSFTCLDASERMAAAARARLSKLDVRVVVGRAEALPFAGASFDAVLLLNVLTCVEQPEAVIAEAARVLRPGGRLLVSTLDRHEHLDIAERYGHVRPGVAPAKLRAWLEAASLEVERCSVTSHERREPRFGVVTALAIQPAARASEKPAPQKPPKKNRARP